MDKRKVPRFLAHSVYRLG